VWSCLSLLVVTVAVSSCSWAVERELCGVRLGDRALSLLDKPGYGQPAYIGPLGTISVSAAEQQPAGAAAGAAARSGPSGPARAGRAGAMRAARGARGRARGAGVGGAMRGGRRAVAAPGLGGAGAPSGFQTVLTGALGSGARGGRTGAMRGSMRAGAMRGGARAGARAGAARAGARGGRAGAGAAGARAGAAGAGLYWYYRRPGGAVIVFTLSLEGEVTAISLSGISPTPGGRTSRGIGLGHGYMDVVAQYGYPDQSVSSGATLEMTYVDHGVRFTLDSMRVRQIEIGAAIAAAVEAAPAAPEVGPPAAGMSPEELRGYL
jgi:hypothetical protein